MLTPFKPIQAGFKIMDFPDNIFGLTFEIEHLFYRNILSISLVPTFKIKRFFLGIGISTLFVYKNNEKNNRDINSFKDRFIPSAVISIGVVFGSKFKFGISLDCNIYFTESNGSDVPKLFFLKIFLGC